MIVDLTYLNGVLAYTQMINDEPLENITWVHRGKEVHITPEQLNDWKFVGLNNISFAEMHLIKDENEANGS